MFCATLSRERATKKEGCHIETEEKKAAGVIERREKNRHIIGCLLPSSLPPLSFLLVAVSHYHPLIYSYSANLDHLPPNKCLSTSRNGKKEFYIRCVSSSTSLPNYACKPSNDKKHRPQPTFTTPRDRLSCLVHFSSRFCFFLTHCHIHEAKIRSL